MSFTKKNNSMTVEYGTNRSVLLNILLDKMFLHFIEISWIIYHQLFIPLVSDHITFTMFSSDGITRTCFH